MENYTYDRLGRFDVLTDGAGGLIVDYDYDAAGRVVKETFGNGVYTTYGFNVAGRKLVNKRLRLPLDQSASGHDGTQLVLGASQVGQHICLLAPT